MQKKFVALFCCVMFYLSCASTAKPPAKAIHVNQIGFYPTGRKVAVVTEATSETFVIASPDLKTNFYEGKLSGVLTSSFSSTKTSLADFSDFTKEGTYVVVVAGVGASYPFEIKSQVHAEVAKASLKAFYFQRFSSALSEPYAGKWSRPASHADMQVLIHPSAASNERPANTAISSPRGWIDAGDYNKYIVNSGITMATLLSAFEDFPAYYNNLKTNIPESNNALPDILDEVLWNLRWMLTMQDPNDGGVYHKCTNANFDPMVMPNKAVTPRYVVQKCTAAALDFAAVTAQASRIFGEYETALPGLADSCLQASEHAWRWAKAHPNVVYNQEQLNKNFDPDITTGAYGDGRLSDEWTWAAAELAITKRDGSYLQSVSARNIKGKPVASWFDVEWLGYFALLRHSEKLSLGAKGDSIKNELLAKANDMVMRSENQYYNTVMGADAKDFVWGSNAVAGNQAILLLQAYRISKDKRFFDGALSNLDYLLGRNATGYSFVTGYGDKTPMHIHHRPSEADGIAEPVPGLLAGGPNPGMQDKCSYPSSVPDEAYVDDVCSYASNEIAINWNAPFVYLSGAIESIQSGLNQ